MGGKSFGSPDFLLTKFSRGKNQHRPTAFYERKAKFIASPTVIIRIHDIQRECAHSQDKICQSVAGNSAHIEFGSFSRSPRSRRAPGKSYTQAIPETGRCDDKVREEGENDREFLSLRLPTKRRG